MASEPCHPPLVVLSRVQPSSHRCQNLVSQGSHYAAQFAASCGHAVLAASKLVERKSPTVGFSRSIGSTTSASCPTLGVTAMSFAQPRTMAHDQRSRIRRAKPQVSRFDSFEELFDVLLNHAALSQLHKHLRQRNWAKLGCGICCRGSGFLGPQSSGAIVPAVRSFAVQYGTTARVQVPIHSRNTAGHTLRPSNSRNASIAPTTESWLGRQHNSPGHSLHQLRWCGGVNFAAACLTAAHYLSFSAQSRVRQYQQQPVSVFCDTRTLVCRICKAARMLQESILSEARIVSAFSVVLCCRVCVPSPRQPHRTTNRARTYARALSTRLSLPMPRAFPPTQWSTFASQASLLRHPHVRCPHRPSQATWGPTRPVGLQQPQPGRTLNHVAWSIGDGTACDVATAS